ncbi:divergent protein kinase domain 1C [Bacillus rossius redtenbacheri]|uniref:divergent protein kinase domain 1C n=1 Tax=Bacillus rossius redtenbacheri TaxID=93214 RepID=UPI002FDEFA3D
MINLKRIPGILYQRRRVSVAVICTSLVIYYLFKFGIVCTNIEIWSYVSKLCQLHRDGKAVGSLCKPLCTDGTIESVSCYAFHVGKEAVFSAEWQGTKMVFKSPRSQPDVDPVHWVSHDGRRQYPDEQQFQSMVRELVASRLNLSTSSDQLKRISHLGVSKAAESSVARHEEMDNVWALLHDNEYLLSVLYSDRGVFPQLLGTCGTLFAVEYVRPVESAARMFSVSEGRNEWASRLRLASMMLDLLEEVEVNFPEPFSLCDVKMGHFGVTADGQRLKFLDLDSVFPRTVANRVAADGSACERDEDCDFFDCRSRCGPSRVCDAPVVNNNHQVVCEKIFLGWALSGATLVPGLLVSRHTPSTLAVLLRMCASPDSGTAPPDDVKRRLYALLTELLQALGNEEFL